MSSGGRNPARYRQIAADIRRRVEDGEWPVDEQISTLGELQEYYKASKNTIDKALGVLREAGLLETIHGTGTFVREPPPSEADLADEVRRMSERMSLMEKQIADLLAGKRHDQP